MNRDEAIMTAQLTSKVDQMLADQSFHIEFHGYLSNHAKHAIIALHGLGATDEAIAAFVDDYAKTTYGFGLEPAKPSDLVLTEATWRKLLGKHEEFEALRSFFEERVRTLGMQETLRRYAPELLPGMVGALLHGTIHLGWALDAGHEGMVVEGLAYLAFAFVSCHPTRDLALPRSNTDQTPLASLERVATEWSRNKLALGAWVDETLEMPELRATSGFQPALEHTGLQLDIARVLARGHALLEATPAWARRDVTDETWKELYYAVSVLFLCNPGDFVLLHLITSLHAVENIAEHLPQDAQKQAIACYWKSLVGVLFALKAVPSAAQLTTLGTKYAARNDGADDAEALSDWKSMTARALQEREEHNPKLVYVLRKLWDRFGQAALYRASARHFTTTPVLSPDAEFLTEKQGA